MTKKKKMEKQSNIEKQKCLKILKMCGLKSSVFFNADCGSNKNKTKKSHLQCTGVLYINYLHVIKVK